MTNPRSTSVFFPTHPKNAKKHHLLSAKERQRTIFSFRLRLPAGACACAPRMHFFAPRKTSKVTTWKNCRPRPRFVVVTYKTVVSMDRPTVLHRCKTVPSVQITDRRFIVGTVFFFYHLPNWGASEDLRSAELFLELLKFDSIFILYIKHQTSFEMKKYNGLLGDNIFCEVLCS